MKNERIDERLNPIKDLEFVFTEDMKENVFEMLTLQQLLDNQELSKRERKLIEKQKQKLFNKFRTRLQELNPTQTLIVRQFLNIK